MTAQAGAVAAWVEVAPYMACIGLAAHALASGRPDWALPYIAASLVIVAIRRRGQIGDSK